MLQLTTEAETSRCLDAMFRDYNDTPFSLRTADAWHWSSDPSREPAFTIVLKSTEAMTALLRDPTELTLGEAFINGHIDVEGDILSVFPMAEHLFSLPPGLENRVAIGLRNCLSGFARLCKHGVRHSRERDRAAIAAHYDQPCEFFRPWLGETMAYSCAYFRSPDECLDQAQINKLELICRKLGVRSGDRFLDVGCGWGSLILHASQMHGADSRGITLSRAQAAVATGRITDAGLGNRCKVEFRDFRDAAGLGLAFDKVASVGMFEHVGLAHLRQYFSTVYDLLKPGGLFLNHGIARSAGSPPAQDSFIDEHVFPDGQLVPISVAADAAEAVGFEVRDLENLREHYVKTLLLWVDGIQQNAREVIAVSSEKAYRTWLLYMAGSAFAFDTAKISVFQLLLRRPDERRGRAPAIREPWYEDWPNFGGGC